MFRRRSSRARRADSLPRRRPRIRQRRLSLEPLEERPLLAVMTVTALTDDTLANLAGDSQLSLREAIQAINTGMNVDGIGPTSGVFGVDDEIQFVPSLFAGGPQSITLADAAGELGLTRAMTITGPGASLLTISAGDGADNMPNTGDGFRIFNIDDATATDRAATLTGLTLTGGDVTGDGGAIRSVETLAVIDSVITGNAAFGAPADGGGIYFDGISASLAVSGSTITNNVSGRDGGGINAYSAGGAILISLSTITGNQVDFDGGGIDVYTDSGTIQVSNCTISGNFNGTDGGGVYVGTNSGTARIISSTIADNSVTSEGGGIDADTNTGTIEITSSTISGNESNNIGGGINASFGTGTISIAHSTITDNQGDFDNNASGSGGGVYADGTGTLNVTHTIIAGNFANSGTAPDIDPPAALGDLNLTFSLIGDNSDSGLAAGNPDASGNKIGTMAAPIDPLLGPLLPNGGPTSTHELLTGSPAIDSGNPAFVPPPTSDQRGAPFLRLFDAGGGALIDIGAYERQTVIPLNLVVDTLLDENDGNYSAGDLSLREAVGLANGSVGVDTITFAAQLNGGTILLTHGEIRIAEEVAIDASNLTNRLTIDASGNDNDPATDNGGGSRIFHIDDGIVTDQPVEIRRLRLIGGDVSGDGGAIDARESLTLFEVEVESNAATSSGAGIAVHGNSFNLTRSTVSGNAGASFGGGVYVSETQTLILDSTLAGNSAEYGGGIYSNTALDGTPGTVIRNSTISGNSATGRGGGVRNINGYVRIEYSTITLNTAPAGTGSGVASYGDTDTLTRVRSSIIAGNTNSDVDFVPGAVNSFESLGFNLIGTGNAVGEFVAGGDMNNVANPGLAPLASTGGPTRTHRVLSTSPALDNGDPAAVAGAGNVPQFDQRGAPITRVFDGNGGGVATIDIGAFELVENLLLPDDFEDNDTFATAAPLGSPPFETIRNLTIHDTDMGEIDLEPPDQDFYKYVAHDTGKLYVRIYFTHALGDLDLHIHDRNDNIIAQSLSVDDDEEIIIPVVGQQMYTIHVFGAGGEIDTNEYTLEIENFPTPVPTGVILDPASDTGMMDNDEVTSDNTPTLYIQTDVLNFVDTNGTFLFEDPDTILVNPDAIDVLTAAEAAAANQAGIAVQVTLVNATTLTSTTFFADPLIATSPEVYVLTIPAAMSLADGVYIVSARTVIFDGLQNLVPVPTPAVGRSDASPPLRLVIDTAGAAAGAISADMLDASDTGMFDDDNVTNKMQPAFQGIAPVGSKVRIFANGELVGQTVAGSDSSDVGHAVGGIGGLATDGLGLWEITVEPLADNGYDIRVEVEDAAGNVTEFDPRFNGPDQRIDIVIDTLDPNTPFLDLSATHDTGRHDEDNITRANQPRVTMTSSDPNINLAQLLFQDNLKFRIYDRYENLAEFKLYDSALDPVADAVNVAGDMFTSLTLIPNLLPEQFFALFGTNSAVLNVGGFGVLADGVHNLKLEVEDRAGNISHDFLLEMTVDTLTPPISFGLIDGFNDTDGLTASSESGVTFLPDTFGDRVTSDTTPTLWGRAEADSVVRLYLDRNANGVIDLVTDTFLGQTTAIPLDGNDAEPDGYWEITSALDVNQLLGIPKDGLRRLLATAEDVAGNPVPANVGDLPVINEGVASLHIFIDTQGPQITDVTINDLSSDIFDLFDPKPTQHGPTPPIDSLTIHFRDLPSRVDQPGALNDFLYAALAFDNANQFGAAAPGNYVLLGDSVGVVPIESVVVNDLGAAQIAGTLTNVTSVTVVSDANLVGDALQPEIGDYIRFDAGPAAGQVRRIVNYNAATGQMTLDIPLLNLPNAGDAYTVTKVALATVTLNFFEPLPDDRYTFTISDSITDPANNALDGETNPPEPQEDPFFPSGDGVPGGDFVARFTVDTRPEIGVWAAGIVHIDTNGNFYFDPENVDFTNRDLVYTLGFSSDYIFAGNFVQGAGGVADGFDKLAVYGRVGDQWRFLIDFDNDGVPDEEFLAPTVNGIPVAGNFDGNAANGDEVGIFTGSAWFFDTNHDFIVDDGFATQYAGFPVAGDFDADGDDDVATYIASQAGGNFFHIDINTAGLGSDININGSADHTFRIGVPGLGTFGFPGVRERPVAADMNADGADDLGLWVPDGTAILPGDQGEWFFLLSDIEERDEPNGEGYGGGYGIVGETVIDRIIGGGVVDFVPFSTTPFGNDLYARFGNSFALPIVGNFDPPVRSTAAVTPQTAQPAPSKTTTTTTSSTTSSQVSTPQRAGSSSTPTTSNPSSTTTAPKTSIPAAASATKTPTATPTKSTTATVAAATTAVTAKKVAVPAITPASTTNKSAAKPAKTTTVTNAAKKIAVPAVHWVTASAAKTPAPKTTTTKLSKSSIKVTTPVIPPPAKTAKAAKVTKATSKKASVAAPKVTVAAKAALPAANSAAKTFAVPAVIKSVAAVHVQTVTTIDAYATLAPATIASPQLLAQSSPLVTAAKSTARPVQQSVAVVRVAPVATRPTITAPIAVRPVAPSVQVSTISGSLNFITTNPAEPIRLTGHTLFESAVADAAVTDLRLTLADVTTDTDTIAAGRQSDIAWTDTDDRLIDDADDELVLAMAWDSVSLRVN